MWWWTSIEKCESGHDQQMSEHSALESAVCEAELCVQSEAGKYHFVLHDCTLVWDMIFQFLIDWAHLLCVGQGAIK